MKPVILTQAEANATLIRNIGSLTDFDEMLKEAGKKGDSNRVIEVSKIIEILRSANDKLLDAGATMDWIL